MPGYDFRKPRLYVDAPLADGRRVALERGQAHYLTTVLRLKAGQEVLVFNGRDGEWRAMLEGGKREAALRITARARAQTAASDLHYLFAPLKSARLDYMVQKAVEMGVSHLRPVLTQHGQVTRVNLERMRANAIEAAEQCGVLSLPEIAAPVERPEPPEIVGPHPFTPTGGGVFVPGAATTPDPRPGRSVGSATRR